MYAADPLFSVLGDFSCLSFPFFFQNLVKSALFFVLNFTTFAKNLMKINQNIFQKIFCRKHLIFIFTICVFLGSILSPEKK